MHRSIRKQPNMFAWGIILGSLIGSFVSIASLWAMLR